MRIRPGPNNPHACALTPSATLLATPGGGEGGVACDAVGAAALRGDARRLDGPAGGDPPGLGTCWAIWTEPGLLEEMFCGTGRGSATAGFECPFIGLNRARFSPANAEFTAGQSSFTAVPGRAAQLPTPQLVTSCSPPRCRRWMWPPSTLWRFARTGTWWAATTTSCSRHRCAQKQNGAIVLRVHTPCCRVHEPHPSAPTAAA